MQLLESKGFTDWNAVVSFGKYRITAASMLCFSNQRPCPSSSDKELSSSATPPSSSSFSRWGGGGYGSSSALGGGCLSDSEGGSSGSSSDSSGSSVSREAARQKIPQDREQEMFVFLLERGLLRCVYP